jgi:hypothetical protein
MRILLSVLLLTIAVWTVQTDVWAVPSQEWGIMTSTNFESLLPIGLLDELASAPNLIGVGGYLRLEWIWGLHARPWGQLYLSPDRTRFAGGLDLLWGDPRQLPNLAYVGFGLSLSNFLPFPVTNFVLGYEQTIANTSCNLFIESRFLFLSSFLLGFGCGF